MLAKARRPPRRPGAVARQLDRVAEDAQTLHLWFAEVEQHLARFDLRIGSASGDCRGRARTAPLPVPSASTSSSTVYGGERAFELHLERRPVRHAIGVGEKARIVDEVRDADGSAQLLSRAAGSPRRS